MSEVVRMKRLVSGGGLAGLLFLAVLSIQPPRSGHTEGSARVRIRGKCNTCHKAHADEWKGSPHQLAWTAPLYVKMSEDHSKTECLGCHAPDSLQSSGVGKEPAVRDNIQDSGVDCVGCHQDADEVIHGAQGLNSQDHKVIKDEKLGTVEMCASCHTKYGTVDEFKASSHATEPKACAQCHMPEVARPIAEDGPERTSHTHTFRAKGNPELLKDRLVLDASVAGDKLVVKLVSKDIGHKVPTGYDTKQVIIEVKLGDLVKTAVLSKQAPEGDNRLAPGATFTFEVPTEGKKGKATVRVLHKASPEATEDETKVLLTTDVEV